MDSKTFSNLAEAHRKLGCLRELYLQTKPYDEEKLQM